LRGFSAPVNLTIDLSEDDLAFLMVHDSDLYNRWQAAQTAASRAIIEAVGMLKNGKRSRRGQRLANALKHTLCDETLEPAYRAQFVVLPSESDIARQIGSNVDPQLIHDAREGLLRTIGRTLYEDLRDIYQRFAQKGPYSPDAASAGKRALRNAALALIAARGESEDVALVAAQFDKARNMTDQTAALSILADVACPERAAALERFEKRWRTDPLVLDKWFTVQAMSALPDTPETVEALMRHPQFSIQNPNRVRALIGAFAMFNQLGFNRADGMGYRLVADAVITLNAFNPQVAARLLGAFRSWRMLEPGRRKLAKRALQRVADSPELSRDVYEIVTRTLDA
jgi:aminopeptidase N